MKKCSPCVKEISSSNNVMDLYFQLADVQFLTHFNTSDVDIDDKETIEVHGFLIKNCIGTLRVYTITDNSFFLQRVLDAATNLITTNRTLHDKKEVRCGWSHQRGYFYHNYSFHSRSILEINVKRFSKINAQPTHFMAGDFINTTVGLYGIIANSLFTWRTGNL